MKKVLTIVLFIFFILSVSTDVRAQKTIKLDTYLPFEVTPTAMPSPVPSYTPTPISQPEKSQHATHPSPTPVDDGTCHFSWPADDKTHLTFGKMHIAQYKGWLNSNGAGVTPTQDQWKWTENQLYEFIDQVSGDLYNRSFLYGKAVARLAITQGFGLDNKKELHETLSPLSCDERGNKVGQYLESPLFLYPMKKQNVKVSLPESIIPSSENSQYTVENREKVFNVVANTDGEILLSNGVKRNYIAYDNPDISWVKDPLSGKVLSYSTLRQDLADLSNTLGLNDREEEAFIDYFSRKLPKAKYYIASLVDEYDAEAVMPWKIYPTPDTQIRLLFFFKPLVSKPIVQDQKIEKVRRYGFTVLDFAGIVKY